MDMRWYPNGATSDYSYSLEPNSVAKRRGQERGTLGSSTNLNINGQFNRVGRKSSGEVEIRVDDGEWISIDIIDKGQSNSI